jgi:hypothetical protein
MPFGGPCGPSTESPPRTASTTESNQTASRQRADRPWRPATHLKLLAAAELRQRDTRSGDGVGTRPTRAEQHMSLAAMRSASS